MYIQQTKEEQLEILLKELQNALELHQLPTFVLCCYLKVMIEIGLLKSDINEYFTTFPVTDALNECKTVIDQLVDDDPGIREKEVLGTTLGRIMTLHKDAVGIDTFMETHLGLPIQEPISYLNSIEDRMNCARQGFDIVDFAYWWSAWNITKVKGSMDNSFWENRYRLTDSDLFKTLNEFMNILMRTDSHGNYIHDVFKNPSMDNDWDIPCEVVILAVRCLKHFIDLDDLPQA